MNTLQAYLKEKGHDVQKGTEQSRDGLVNQVKYYWHETEDQAQEAYLSVKDWIFDTYVSRWTIL